VACSFEFELWAWPLEASHFGRPSREAVGVHGQRFELCAWPSEASHYAELKAPLTILFGYFQLISLDSQQSLATQGRFTRLGRP
jgi:hypothetical protein